MHPEFIKAELRKQFGTLLAFERAKKLPRGSAKDVLRGRPVAGTERAIAKVLKKPLHQLFPWRYGGQSSAKVDDKAPDRGAHRQIVGGR